MGCPPKSDCRILKSMNQTEIIDVARETIMMIIQIAGPVMVVGLIVGVLIALVQALTQIQEITLVFVPKIVAIFLSIFVLFPAFVALMTGFMEHLADKIVGIG